MKVGNPLCCTSFKWPVHSWKRNKTAFCSLFLSSSLKERRHDRVKTWTRHVDLFSKDFIIVPINEQ